MIHLRSYELAVQFYREAKAVSMAHYLKDQLRRAALSVALNLAEGTGKSSRADRRRFFEIAFGSIRELQAIVEIESQAFTTEQKDLLDHLAAATYKLIKHSRLRPRATLPHPPLPLCPAMPQCPALPRIRTQRAAARNRRAVIGVS